MLYTGSIQDCIKKVVENVYLRFGSRQVGLADITVKVATRFQMWKEVRPEREERWAKFLQYLFPLRITRHYDAALDSWSDPQPYEPSPAEFKELRAVFAAYFHMKIDNKIKEIFWDLVYNAVPCSDRFRGGRVVRCACGHEQPGRRHLFWECSGLQQVRADIRAALGFDVSLTDIWLARSPTNVKPWIWRAVCLATLAAGNMVRKLSYKLAGDLPEGTPVNPTWVRRIDFSSRMRFLSVLLDFVHFNVVSEKFIKSISPQHPFIYRSNSQLRVKLPQLF